MERVFYVRIPAAGGNFISLPLGDYVADLY